MNVSKLLLVTLTILTASCSSMRPRVEGLVGVRNFDDSREWEQTDNQAGAGVQLSFAPSDGIGLEASYIVTSDSSDNFRFINRHADSTYTQCRQLAVGLRKNWMLSQDWQAYLSGGLARNELDTHVDLAYPGVLTDHSIAYCAYAQTGVNYNLSDRWSLGVLYRRTFAGEDNNSKYNDPTTDSNMLFLSLGYGF